MMREDVACQQVVELLTDYLDHSLPPDERVALEQHLQTCGPCTTYLEQLRTSIRLIGRLDEKDVPDEVMDRLLHLFTETTDQ